ncbi:MAG: DUF5106 domain-containing protein [Flavobacteriales bacterium]|jgi:thiol-disulfide isomerase/thioredoxin|nr:DUF5106 domain-containing protein [Flavobacteriales bacterium]
MKNLIVLLLIGLGFSINAQYNLKFKIDGLKDTTVYLAKYLGNRLYYADTTEAKNGVAQFKKEHYDGGVYAVICPGPKYFEFIMADKDVEIETSMDDFVKNMKIIKSKENKIFYDYIRFINLKKPEAKLLSQAKAKLDPKKDKKKIAELDQQGKALDAEVKNYQKQLATEHKDLLIGRILNMSIDPEIPVEIKENDTLRYKYYKQHFWDNIMLEDERLVHSPVFHNKLEFFFQKMLLQQPDTICENAHQIINRIKEGTDMFKYVVHYVTYNYETSKIMGMDAVFVCMADTYYCPPEATKAFWIEDEKLVELCERKEALKPLLVNKVAPNIRLADTSEKKWINLHKDVNNKYIGLVFWADDCGHCKKEMPKIKELYDELKAKGVDIEIVAVGTSLENDGWRKVIKDKKLNWINISDFPGANKTPEKYIFEQQVTDLQSLNFRKTYDIFSTPQIYLLNQDKVILAKKLDALNLAKMMEIKEKLDELDFSKKETKARAEEERKKKEREEKAAASKANSKQ